MTAFSPVTRRTPLLRIIVAGLTITALSSLGAQEAAHSVHADPGQMHEQQTSTVAAVKPGYDPRVAFGDGHNPYAANPAAITEGRQYFVQYNCSGCHGTYGEGGMGPNLRGGHQHGGHTDSQLFAAIMEGRPKGMPAWGAALPKDHIWKIVAYLRVLGTDQEPQKPSS